jgi:hypothetical protein
MHPIMIPIFLDLLIDSESSSYLSPSIIYNITLKSSIVKYYFVHALTRQAFLLIQ